MLSSRKSKDPRTYLVSAASCEMLEYSQKWAAALLFPQTGVPCHIKRKEWATQRESQDCVLSRSEKCGATDCPRESRVPNLGASVPFPSDQKVLSESLSLYIFPKCSTIAWPAFKSLILNSMKTWVSSNLNLSEKTVFSPWCCPWDQAITWK